MRVFFRDRDRAIQTIIGAGFILMLVSALYYSPKPLQKTLKFLENGAYDFQIRKSYRPVQKESPVVILDFDDKSIAAEGRWPWSRKKLGVLLNQLFESGATVVAFDVTFPDEQDPSYQDLIQSFKNNPQTRKEIEAEISISSDEVFAKALKKGTSVLGFAFKKEDDKIGVLPKPIFTPTETIERSLDLPKMNGYLANTAILQDAAINGGFINSSPGVDGILRNSPLILQYGGAIYPSLGFRAAQLYLADESFELFLANYGVEKVLEGIQLKTRFIPTDSQGRILIPFRGPPYSIPSVSASDALKGILPASTFKDKLVFAGSSATAMGDLIPTAISPVFSGVEVHAAIALGIIEDYLPYLPVWADGFTVAIVLLAGLILAFFIPRLGIVCSLIICMFLAAGFIGLNQWAWNKNQVYLPIIYPIFSIAMLFGLNSVLGYFFENRRRKELKSIFGQYVPPEYLDYMLTQKTPFSQDGETKELTVLFADIRNFTAISEKMSAKELKRFLNRFLTEMTRVIFEKKGTIDKYVGDMIMAFWGAPIEDKKNAYDAVSTALKMQSRLLALNQELNKENRPTIRVGIGINTGLMNVGDMGSQYRRAYTVIGDAVNLASRLEGISKFYHVKIIVGEETYQKTKEDFIYRVLDKICVKGKSEPLFIYEPIGFAENTSNPLQLLHNEAMELYFQKKWDEAESQFKKLQGMDKEESGLYDVYLERIQHYKTTPPPSNWDGTFIFESK